VALKVNGSPVSLTFNDPDEFLLYLLRQQLGLNGPRFGCGISQCGCCTVLVNGAAVRSCVKVVSTLNAGDTITTLEGIGTPASPHPLQQAFIDNQAGQCAFCSNAMIMGALSWINGRVKAGNTAVPSQQEIAAFLSGPADSPDYPDNEYICRCGAHLRILDAIREAAGKMLS
jgi:aerobic-type carbon monoxide dehydrogenase small subunit (CoxS/CutS family)